MANIFSRILKPRAGIPTDKTANWSSLKHIPAFLKLVWETHKGMTAANVSLRLLKSLMPLLMLWVGKEIIDEVLLLLNHSGTMSTNHLWMLVLLELILTLVNEILSRGISLLDALLGDLFANKSSIKLMEHASRLDLEQFEQAGFYDKLERARRQTLQRTVLMTQVLSVMQDLVSLVSLAAGLVLFNPWLILLLIISVIPSFLGESHFNSRSYSLVHSFTPERRELDYLRHTAASDETAKEVKLFGLSAFLTERFKTLSDTYYDVNRKLSLQRAGWGLLLSIISTAGYYAAYVVILMNTLAAKISVGELTFLSGSFARMRGLMEGILGRLASIAQGAMYLEDFYAFFALEPNIKAPLKPIAFPRPIKEGFKFENVGFKYPNSEKWALRNVSFTLHPAEKIALVGENGSGKTTLVKLLGRLYDPSEGQILLDGHPLSAYDPDELRMETGVIFQDFVKFQFTAGMNIATGQIEQRNDQDRIQLAATQSLASEVIDNLQNKYAQMIGRRFADGVDLSGGQWQKIALGRAYMRDAQLVILDEPTAALDARAEHEVFERFATLSAGKTAVIISHRFSTVRMADRILVLRQGKLIESGTHNQLVASGGLYAELFELQAKGYQ
jgi:ATP-binding cassette, subfamily B, bacterial